MAILPYLAMTEAEMGSCSALPEKIAYMACHFSPYGTGLQDLPPSLPPNSLLILDDRIPVAGHDPGEIAEELHAVTEALPCRLLLDLQRPGSDAIVDNILKKIPQAVVSESYAKGRDCPVFLPPVPLTRSLAEHIAQWQNREIWLDAAVECCTVTVTEKGSRLLPCSPNGEFPFADPELHCRYRIELKNDRARFVLYRAKEDVEALLSEAEALGVFHGVGLYQQLQ